MSPSPLDHLTVGKTIAIVMSTMVALLLITSEGIGEEKELRVAMIGNSLMYYNDLPRLLEAMSGGKLSQDSCLHGSASFKSHLLYGNGMFVKWDTGNARIWNVYNSDYEAAADAYQTYMESVYSTNDDVYSGDDSASSKTYQLDTKYNHIYDFGACTVRQLLLGVDDRLVEEYETEENQYNRRQRRIEAAQQISIQNPESSALRLPTDDTYKLSAHRRLEDNALYDDTPAENTYAPADGDEAMDYYAQDDDSFYEDWPLTDDGRNPCLLSANYYFFKQSQYDEFNGGVPKWDYILLNDNSRGPCCTSPREEGLELLVDVYVPWILKTGAVPVFMVTHAYWPSTRDMSGLTDIPTFMSLTYEGYRQYALAIGKYLPEHQQPKLAPVGLAFLMIWEESPNMWEKLIHMDEIHLTPTGTFLEGLIVYATLYGHLPSPSLVLNGNAANLYSNARRMTPSEHIQEAYPTLDDARYLYHIASRIMKGEIPRTFIQYQNGESVDFTASKKSSSSSNNSNR
mmetsp:Transcript_4529/g.10948  ORF Transcript_4529/g.10948 Transcript_4529/m.10948 type:complete len:513 (-) Transcript_4529:135-1673(-)